MPRSALQRFTLFCLLFTIAFIGNASPKNVNETTDEVLTTTEELTTLVEDTTSVSIAESDLSITTETTDGCILTTCPPANEGTPVCASDHVVYDSECQMNLQSNCSLEVVDWEECRGLHPLCPADCLDIQDPVCGEDGRIYPNKCVMHKRNCGRRIGEKSIIFCLGGHRKSRNQNKCPDTCLEYYRPVCGSDGQIYLNECYLRKQNCRRKVSKVEMSECVAPPTCPVNCIPIYDPVCGSNGKLYINQCIMQRDNCANQIKNMPLQFCVGDQIGRL